MTKQGLELMLPDTEIRGKIRGTHAFDRYAYQIVKL
jgi:hypothetical protein